MNNDAEVHREAADPVDTTTLSRSTGFEAKDSPMLTLARGRMVMREDAIITPQAGDPVRFLETLAA